jgi:hypothetical protein
VGLHINRSLKISAWHRSGADFVCLQNELCDK